MVAFEQVKSLKVQELKQELKNIGLPQTGKKEELQKRLEDALSPEAPKATPATATATPAEPAAKEGAVNGRAPVEFKSREPEAQLPAATGLKDPEGSAAEEPVPAKPLTGLTEEEKARQRAERFGIVSEKDKLTARAKRFGTATPSASSGPGTASKTGGLKASAEDPEKRKERAKRFNLPEVLTKEEAELKKKARLERFDSGKEKQPAEDSSALASKLAARAERFALSKGPTPAKPGDAVNGASQDSKPKADSAADRKQAALAKAAAQVKPAANPEAEAKRQARAIVFQAG